jgi:hypothetical protein
MIIIMEPLERGANKRVATAKQATFWSLPWLAGFRTRMRIMVLLTTEFGRFGQVEKQHFVDERGSGAQRGISVSTAAKGHFWPR